MKLSHRFAETFSVRHSIATSIEIKKKDRYITIVPSLSSMAPILPAIMSSIPPGCKRLKSPPTAVPMAIVSQSTESLALHLKSSLIGNLLSHYLYMLYMKRAPATVKSTVARALERYDHHDSIANAISYQVRMYDYSPIRIIVNTKTVKTAISEEDMLPSVARMRYHNCNVDFPTLKD